jgi:1-deoxy-D-xylulose-5-phosphate reductoisomerase
LLADRVKAEGLSVEVLWGAQALDAVASHPDVHAVMAAIVGAAGLSPCLAAAHAGKRLLLANKEALVVGGDVFLSAVKKGGAVLLPIDSEHSAAFSPCPKILQAGPIGLNKLFSQRRVAPSERGTSLPCAMSRQKRHVPTPTG